jgi:adenosine deaminase
MVKYMPSINVSYGVKEAEENYRLFSKLNSKYPDYICGIDLSGDASKGKFAEMRHIFEAAREEGFRFGIHCGESLDELQQGEVLEKLKFMTSEDRIGHGTFIEGNNENKFNFINDSMQ